MKDRITVKGKGGTFAAYIASLPLRLKQGKLTCF
jgi:hypothetical protein